MDLTLGSGWPFGGPHIPIAQASGSSGWRACRSPAGTEPSPPTLAEGEKLIAQIRQGPNTFFFIASHTRQKVKRPAVGAEGCVLDHYDRAAIQNHLKTVGEPMLRALAKTPPYAIFSDSLEVYNSDWTGNFLDEFRKRRGYDLTPYLPALAGDIGEKTGAIRHDWGKTLTRTRRRALPQAAHRVGPPARHAVPLADLRHSAGDALEQRAGGPAGGRGQRSGGASPPRAGRPPRAICTGGR